MERAVEWLFNHQGDVMDEDTNVRAEQQSENTVVGGEFPFPSLIFVYFESPFFFLLLTISFLRCHAAHRFPCLIVYLA